MKFNFICECASSADDHTLSITDEEYAEASQLNGYVCAAKCEYAQEQIDSGEYEIIFEHKNFIVLIHI